MVRDGGFVFLYGPADGSGPMTAEAHYNFGGFWEDGGEMLAGRSEATILASER